ncbi:MAG: hypothetical protein ACFE0Q_11265 [Anaerolineae bacterium]
MLVFTGPKIDNQRDTLELWWQQVRREHRLFLRMVHEEPGHLQGLAYLGAIQRKVQHTHTQTLRASYPEVAKEARSYLLSAERAFMVSLDAMAAGNMAQAYFHQHKALNELSLLQYIFMENSITLQL